VHEASVLDSWLAKLMDRGADRGPSLIGTLLSSSKGLRPLMEYHFESPRILELVKDIIMRLQLLRRFPIGTEKCRELTS